MKRREALKALATIPGVTAIASGMTVNKEKSLLDTHQDYRQMVDLDRTPDQLPWVSSGTQYVGHVKVMINGIDITERCIVANACHGTAEVVNLSGLEQFRDGTIACPVGGESFLLRGDVVITLDEIGKRLKAASGIHRYRTLKPVTLNCRRAVEHIHFPQELIDDDYWLS
jgi:hypothetical protein